MNGLDATIYRVDSSGILEWTRTFGGTGDDAADQLLCLNDGGFLFSGMAGLTTNITGDFYIVRTDANGLVSGTTGIPEETSSAVNLFPNPATDKVNWSTEESDLNFISIYSLEGALIEVISSPHAKGYFSTKNYSPGIYILNVRTSRQQFFEKLIVTH